MARQKKISETQDTKFGKGETVCLTFKINSKPKYYITSTVLRDTYYLYEDINGIITKTKHKADNPTDLYKYMKG